eukprot:3631719-Pyramimonas_sp.AAC.1
MLSVRPLPSEVTRSVQHEPVPEFGWYRVIWRIPTSSSTAKLIECAKPTVMCQRSRRARVVVEALVLQPP